jgi:hypothetical protein
MQKSYHKTTSLVVKKIQQNPNLKNNILVEWGVSTLPTTLSTIAAITENIERRRILLCIQFHLNLKLWIAVAMVSMVLMAVLLQVAVK